MTKGAERSAHVRLLQEVVRVCQADPVYRSAARRIRSAERRYCQQNDDEAEKWVMRAATANMLFDAALEKGAAFRTVERRFREVLKLACGYLPSEVGAYTEFADYCGRRGKLKAGIRLLEGLETDLERREGSVSKGMLAYCRSQVAQFLRRLRKKRMQWIGPA